MVAEAKLRGAPDESHLRKALAEGRVILKQDTDFLRLHAAGRPHAGILYASPKSPIGEIIRGVVLIVSMLDADEMKGHVEFL